MKTEEFKRQLENGSEFFGNSQTIEFVDENGKTLSPVGVNFVDQHNTKKSSALVCSAEEDFLKGPEYTKGDITDFIARNCLKFLKFIIVNKEGKETEYNTGTVLGNCNNGTGGHDKIRIELSNK